MSRSSSSPHIPFSELPSVARLIDIMAQLRHSDHGCPKDLIQTFETIAPYTLEEAYEVVDAIARKNMADLKEELGDLLLQVVYHARMAEEDGAFDFNDVVEGICDKLVRRHPHVFGDEVARTPADADAIWAREKARERAQKPSSQTLPSPDCFFAAANISHLSAFAQTLKIQDRVASVGFDWATPRDVLDKVYEEVEELTQAEEQADRAHVSEEMGDLLFVLTNYCRKHNIDPEICLRHANQKFMRRFNAVADVMRTQHPDCALWTLEDMELAWQNVKRQHAADL